MRFRDIFDPRTGSILFLGGTKPFGSDPFHPGFIAGVEERAELLRRLQRIDPRDRFLLFLWYVEGWSVSDIAEQLGISRVHCYRLRNRALTALAPPTDPALARTSATARSIASAQSARTLRHDQRRRRHA